MSSIYIVYGETDEGDTYAVDILSAYSTEELAQTEVARLSMAMNEYWRKRGDLYLQRMDGTLSESEWKDRATSLGDHPADQYAYKAVELKD